MRLQLLHDQELSLLLFQQPGGQSQYWRVGVELFVLGCLRRVLGTIPWRYNCQPAMLSQLKLVQTPLCLDDLACSGKLICQNTDLACYVSDLNVPLLIENHLKGKLSPPLLTGSGPSLSVDIILLTSTGRCYSLSHTLPNCLLL